MPGLLASANDNDSFFFSYPLPPSAPCTSFGERGLPCPVSSPCVSLSHAKFPLGYCDVMVVNCFWACECVALAGQHHKGIKEP